MTGQNGLLTYSSSPRQEEQKKPIAFINNKIQSALALTENLSLSPHIFQTKYKNIFTFKIIKDFFPLVAFLMTFLIVEKGMKIPLAQRS